MNYLLKFRCVLRFAVLFILIFLFIPNNFSIADRPQWDANWSYSQEIKIPFDTSLEIAHFQPIDINVVFQNPCWAKNVLDHSIRVCCWDKKNWHELESQIYSLEATNNNLIKSCNLVFLIPEFADGTEKYFIFYDDSEKPSPNYFDHVKIEESYYKYEPIPGYPLESYYYKIIDDDYVPYSVSYKGQLMGYNTCQHIVKLKENIVEMLPKNGELFAAFDFKYTYDKGIFSYSSTSQKYTSKEIFIDGNLMVEFRIVSTSKFDDLKTTATYKYYHCPTTNTRFHVHVKHETLKEINVYPNPPATNTDGVIASMQCGGIKSKSIAELNIGSIFPYMHFFNEMETTSEYPLDIDPEYTPGNIENRVISVEDDVDLGKNAWVSFDEGKSAPSHSVIFSSNNILRSGTNEKDGIQLNVFELDYPHLPGLENNIATIQIGRNSFETGENHDLIIPDDFKVEFDAEFFSSKTGGFSIINQEAEIFKELVNIKPQTLEEDDDESDELEKYDLSVIVHFAQSFPMGSSLSALLGLDLPYIAVELYKNEEFLYSSSAVRLPIKAFEELEDPSVLERIINTLKIFDIKNISIFKKAVFPKLEKGRYVIKIFRENPFFSKEKQYIGYQIVDLQKDEKINIFCRSEASIKLKIIDQDNKIVKGAIARLQKDGTTIAKNLTNEKGQAIIKAPTDLQAYNLKVIYNGCTIFQEPVKLGFFQKFIPIEKNIKIQRYNLNLNVIDTWGQIPDIELNPIITIQETDEPFTIRGEKIDDDTFIFKNLIPNNYQLQLTFKSFTFNQNIELLEDKEINIDFPAEFKVKFNIMDARGLPFDNSKIVIERNNKKLEIQNPESKTEVSIPPGEYQVKIYNNNELIGKRTINVYGEQNYDLITNHQPSYSVIVLIVCYLLVMISFLYLYYKKRLKQFYTILIIILFIVALFLPWWEINGSTAQLKTSTKLYLIPNNMITITSTKNTIAGEPSYLPPEFQTAINMIFILTIIGSILLISTHFFKKINKKRLYKISKICAIIPFILSFSLFVIAINELSRVSIGSIMGTDYLDIGVPGESQIQSVLLNWGPSFGFYIYIASIVILFITLSVNIIKKRGFKNEKSK